MYVCACLLLCEVSQKYIRGNFCVNCTRYLYRKKHAFKTTTAEVTLSTKNILLRNGSKFAKAGYDDFEGVMTFEGGVGKLIKKKKNREREREKLEDVKLIRRYS